ncbi:GH25 family lysozyme [Bacillus thuringiensis]|uniref:GH25 family lysozyme n=1 Tax=Bacillus thuringiensis TaxID=1428 RepID=UPI000D0480A0|nr:GH25 family lysozyme [Bacillus thuringiensis]PRT29461.1 N-acetylmuramoyl-L-alanine amidase [Bacillus thuringiensis]
MGHIVDISKWNGNINWDVAAPQLDLAICRVQYGSNKVDEWYKRYVAKLEEYGVPHAAYAYGCYISVNDAIVEADDFMDRTSPNAKFLVLDVEDDTLQSCGANNLAAASQAFIDRCKSKGWKIGLYLSHHMYENYGLSGLKADFLWIPRYGGNKPKYACDIWQYTETGNVPGIGKCDLNYLVGSKPLSWFTSGTEQSVANDGYQYVKSGGFGISLVQEVANAMNERGIKGEVVSDPLTGVAYLQTEVLPNTELDKITWWMDTRPEGKWFYEYIKVK